MAGIQTKCPFCNTFVTGQKGASGIVGECPICDKTFTIPDLENLEEKSVAAPQEDSVSEFICPECGARNIVFSSFIGTLKCVGCQSSIDVIDDSVQVCPHCNQYISVEDKVCMYCNKPVKSEQPAVQPVNPQPTPAVQPAFQPQMTIPSQQVPQPAPIPQSVPQMAQPAPASQMTQAMPQPPQMAQPASIPQAAPQMTQSAPAPQMSQPTPIPQAVPQMSQPVSQPPQPQMTQPAPAPQMSQPPQPQMPQSASAPQMARPASASHPQMATPPPPPPPPQMPQQMMPSPSAQTAKMPIPQTFSDPLGGKEEDEYVLKALSVLKIINILICGIIIITNSIVFCLVNYDFSILAWISFIGTIFGVVYIGAIWHLILCWFRGMYRHSMEKGK